MAKTKQHRIILLLLVSVLTNMVASGQDAFHNYGNLQFHATASVGFHLDMINDGMFDSNSGLTGFYSNQLLTVSGSSSPVFQDLEIFTDNGLQLETWIGVTGNANFIAGDVLTLKGTSASYLNFIDQSFFNGSGDASHINGYAGATNKETITFPVGDGERLRFLTLISETSNALARCAYFREDPDALNSTGLQFPTTEKDSEDLQISDLEFWRLEGEQPSIVTLSWDTNSAVGLLAETVESLLVVGWSKSENRWERLGNTAISGNQQNGSITSETFIPSDYEVITLGGTDDLLEPFTVLDLDNYFMTPNNDGINDFLLIDGIENVPNNVLNIYNRYGVLVYSKVNYANEFDGKSNRNGAISRGSGLSAGVYFYILTVSDTREKFQGYLYISQ
ncbi:gliding motility-associated C-terminal domain-containing protein [Muricauda sp. 2012CJ35-5]|uniref:Gliding motility-associated C-terminal domain-containing protein n=1 Tax=Flagellimonas spongiicola TaxID=2942208 RepID=A0ABT0PXG3_9FLAO|nr:gliding motility-associated C-terminal domain-containing protein [Allomuricauda spongiicola]MCL6275173.1 gliding motility-associated C-terminal domain-containing protein [Allomuricauda spongiicola]